MRKLIVLLLLSLGVKGQEIGIYSPIWTYTGSNIQYTNGSVIAGSLTTAGTLSVGSTATLNTLLLNNSVPVLNLSNSTYAIGRNNYNEGEFFLRYADDFSFIDATNANSPHVKIKDRMFAINLGTVVPTHTLEVNGNAKVSSTFSLGSANLTGGNTGTVAVLSDALFSVNFLGGSLNPADATTYWFGNTILAPSTTSTVGRITLPYNCTLVGYNFNAFVGGVNGTTESVTVTVSGTTNYTLTSSAIFSTAVNNYSSMGLSQSFSANDSENISIICPTWATNPTVVLFGCTLWFVRRS